jgi:transposase
VKRHVLTDGRGVPLSVLITAANLSDKWLVARVLDAIMLRVPRGPRRPKHLCLDKRYDYVDAEAAVRLRGITPHIRRPGEQLLLGCGYGTPRRWVVERTNG